MFSSWLPDGSKKSSTYSPWKHINKIRRFFERNISYKLGNGENIPWETTGLQTDHFVRFFLPFMICLTVSKFWSAEDGVCDLKFRRGLLDRDGRMSLFHHDLRGKEAKGRGGSSLVGA